MSSRSLSPSSPEPMRASKAGATSRLLQKCDKKRRLALPVVAGVQW